MTLLLSLNSWNLFNVILHPVDWIRKLKLTLPFKQHLMMPSSDVQSLHLASRPVPTKPVAPLQSGELVFSRSLALVQRTLHHGVCVPTCQVSQCEQWLMASACQDDLLPIVGESPVFLVVSQFQHISRWFIVFGHHIFINNNFRVIAVYWLSIVVKSFSDRRSLWPERWTDNTSYKLSRDKQCRTGI